MIDESMLLELPPMPRGRPSQAAREERARLAKVVEANRARLTQQPMLTVDGQQVPLPKLDAEQQDAKALEEIRYRFDMLDRYAVDCATGDIRFLIAHGSGGIGKTFNLIRTMENLIPGDYEVIEGGDISPIHLYMAAYRNRKAGKVLIFDDSDSFLTGGKDEHLNILKKLTDSGPVRRLTYRKVSKVLEEENIPDEFLFEGSVLFLSNLNFDTIGTGTDRRSHHMAALKSRALILSLNIHDLRSKYLWIRQVAVESLFAAKKVTEEEATTVLGFLDSHYEDFKTLSIRSVEYLITLLRSDKERWRKDATIMLLK